MSAEAVLDFDSSLEMAPVCSVTTNGHRCEKVARWTVTPVHADDGSTCQCVLICQKHRAAVSEVFDAPGCSACTAHGRPLSELRWRTL